MKIEREAFDHWYSDGVKSARAIERSGTGKYKYSGAAAAWIVWQACAESKQAEIDKLRAELISSDAALKESRANDMESMRQLNEARAELAVYQNMKPVGTRLRVADREWVYASLQFGRDRLGIKNMTVEFLFYHPPKEKTE